MTATLYLVPDCSIDPAEDTVSDTEWAREHVTHPSWCQRDEDQFGTSGLVVHRSRTGGPDRLAVFAERYDEADGTSDFRVRVGEEDFDRSELRDLIHDLWAAYDLGGGAR